MVVTRSSGKKAAAEATPEKSSPRKRFSDGNGGSYGHVSKRPRIQDTTDRTRWRMRDNESRHTWRYLEDDEAAEKWPQSAADKYFLGLPLVCNWTSFSSSFFLFFYIGPLLALSRLTLSPPGPP